MVIFFLVHEKNLTLNEGKATYEYAPGFDILAAAVTATNGSKVTFTERKVSKIFER
jgi:hypothetical protein